MAKLKVDGIEYTISPLPPYLAPYINSYINLSTKIPKDIAEANSFSEQLKQILKKIFEESATPIPSKEHELKVFTEINRLTREASTHSFPDEKPNSKKSRRTRGPTPPTPK